MNTHLHLAEKQRDIMTKTTNTITKILYTLDKLAWIAQFSRRVLEKKLSAAALRHRAMSVKLI